MPTPHRSDQHQLERLTGTLNRLNQSTAPKALTSTATCTNGSTAVVAAAGAFLTEVVAGDGIQFSGDREQVYKIVSITDNDNLVIEPAFRGATAASQAMIGYTGVIDDATLSGLANPGTVSLLSAAILAKSVHASDAHLKVAAAANLRLAAEPFFAMSPPTIGNVTTAVPGGGTLADAGTFYYAVQAIDRNGVGTVLSSEDSVVTGSGGGNDNVNTIPWTDVGGNFTVRVWASAAAGNGASGVYTHYKDVTDGVSTTDATVLRTGWTAQAATTASINAASVAAGGSGFGLVTDDMVDDARDAALFSTLRNAISDQNSRGTAARTDDYATNSPFVP